MGLDDFRREIDAVDEALIRSLARRLRLCEGVAALKAREGIPMMQPDRLRFVRERNARLAETHGIDPELIERLFQIIIDAACTLEDRVIAAAGGA
jgi:chorismate mutase